MKLKGINPFEQHVEKIVVGAVGVGVLGVVAWQLLATTTIPVGKGGEVPLSDAFKPVETEAAKLQQQAENASPELPAGIDITPLVSYADSISKPLTAATPLPAMAPALVLGGTSGVLAGQAVFAGLAAPAPTGLAAAQFRGTVSPVEKVSTPELAQFLPKEQPYDKAAVSVEARFDGKALRAALEADPDGAGPKSALPSDWWMGKTEILAFQVEREEETSEGQWGNATTLPSLPGRLDFLKQWNDAVKEGADVDRVLPDATRFAEDIQRPKYYTMMFGEWVEPNVLIARAANNFDPIRYKQLADDYSKAKASRDAKQEELRGVPTDDPKDPNPPAGNPRDPRGPGAGGGGKNAQPGGGTRNPGAGDPNAKVETNKQKRARLTTEIRRLDDQMKGFAKQIGDMGGALPDAGHTNDPAPAADPAATPSQHLLDDPAVKLYAHDITAEPGKRYRYRARVVLNNPMYGRDIVLKKDDAAQLELAKNSSVASAWTDWSDPVDVDRDAYWFITSTGTDTLRQNIPTARAEMFQFYYGFYRRAEVALEPGDPIIGKADLPKGLWIYDEKKIIPGNPLNQPGGPDLERRGRAPGGKGQRPGNLADPNEPAKPQGKPGELVPEGAVPGRTDLRFTDTASVVFLDVRNVPGTEEHSLAVLKNTEGQVVSKSPDKDRKSDVYRRVSTSADAGVAAAKAPEPEKPKAPKANDNPPPPPVRPPPGGGGGGGGGGG